MCVNDESALKYQLHNRCVLCMNGVCVVCVTHVGVGVGVVSGVVTRGVTGVTGVLPTGRRGGCFFLLLPPPPPPRSILPGGAVRDKMTRV